MSDYAICHRCFQVRGLDADKWCYGRERHRWLAAKVEPCPFLTYTSTGRTTRARRLKAEEECREADGDIHEAHHYGDPERRHFTVERPFRKVSA